MTASVDGSNLVKSFAPELLEVLQALSQLPPGPPGNQSVGKLLIKCVRLFTCVNFLVSSIYIIILFVAQNAKKAVYNMTADRTSENFQQVQQQVGYNLYFNISHQAAVKFSNVV